MDATEKKGSSSLERKVEGYLKPTNYAFIQAYIDHNGGSRSAAINDAVKALREKTQLPEKR